MRNLSIISLTIVLLTSCREDELVSYIQEEQIPSSVSTSSIIGLYLLNEGNMGSNHCTLDYIDLQSPEGDDSHITYYRNIYGERNPGQIKELGDVGNDIAIYGSKLWMTINCSNKVEVCRACDCRHLSKIDIANCRYLAFNNGYAYVSSYAGPVKLGENCPQGRVYKIDTLTMQKVDSVTVGYQPEEIAIVDDKLYVANSGGYRVPLYDDRITVVNLSTFTVENHISVATNMHRLVADKHKQLWVSSRGNYYDIPSCLYWLSPDGSIGKIDNSVNAMCLVGDSLYCIGAGFNYAYGDYTREYFIVDVKHHTVVDTHIFDAPEITSIKLPYGIIVNPVNRDFYLMDAKNYVSSGELLHFKSDGSFDWKVRTGDIPSRATFVTK